MITPGMPTKANDTSMNTCVLWPHSSATMPRTNKHRGSSKNQTRAGQINAAKSLNRPRTKPTKASTTQNTEELARPARTAPAIKWRSDKRTVIKQHHARDPHFAQAKTPSPASSSTACALQWTQETASSPSGSPPPATSSPAPTYRPNPRKRDNDPQRSMKTHLTTPHPKAFTATDRARLGVVLLRLVRACRWRARRLRLALSIVWRKPDHHPSAARLSWSDAWDIADMVHNPHHLWVCA